MKMTDTATVETLTAKVRVMMMGNRQMTLSVVRQLDFYAFGFEPEPWTPLGRVRTGRKMHAWVSCDRNTSGAKQTACGYAHFVQRPCDYEWIARGDNTGDLITVGYVEDDIKVRQSKEDWTWREIGDIREMPLIVLAGLR